MYQIKITEITSNDMEDGIERLVMLVDQIDIEAVIAAANRKPRKPRSDRGKPRPEQVE